MRRATAPGAMLAVCAALWVGHAWALDNQPLGAPLAGVSASAAVGSAPATTAPSVSVAAEPPTAAISASPEFLPDAGLTASEAAPATMSSSAVAGIPLEDGGELVLGPQEKVSSDDHQVATERFQHMRKDGKLAATSDLDREVPRILQREQSGDLRGALLAAHKALARLPHHHNLRQITARLQIANGDYGSALLTLAPLLEIDRDNWLPFYWAGVAELMQLNLDHARAYLVRACQLDADRAEPWIARAVVEQEAGNFAGSLQLFAVARQRSPALAEISNGIAYSTAMLQQSQGVMQQPNAGAGVEAIATQSAPTTSLASPLAITQTSPPAVGNAPAFAGGADNSARDMTPALLP